MARIRAAPSSAVRRRISRDAGPMVDGDWERSAPTEKSPPSARTITTRVSSSAAKPWAISISSRIIWAVIALRRAARLRVTEAIGPSCFKTTSDSAMTPSCFPYFHVTMFHKVRDI